MTTGIASGLGTVTPYLPYGQPTVVGTMVYVTAYASSPGWSFSDWSAFGAYCFGGPYSNPCTFTMPNNPVSITATFAQTQPQTTESTISFQFQGSLTGPISNGQIQLTSGSVVLGGITYNLIGTASTACGTAINVVCTSLGRLSAGQITLNNGYVMGLAACYTALSSSSLSLTFSAEPPNCGESTTITQGFNGPVIADITATGTLTASGSQVTITGTGSAIVNLP